MLRRVLAIIMVLMMAFCTASMADGAQLSVRGAATVNVPADRAYVVFGVRVNDVEVLAAQTRLNQSMRSVVDALKQLGLSEENLTTDAISLYPNYNYDEGEKLESYTAYNTIRARLDDVDQVGACIDAAFEAGANTLDYVEYDASDTEEAAREALRGAVENAAEKARVLAEATGMALGDLVSLTEDPEGHYNMPVMYRVAEEPDAGGGTQVYASQIQVTAVVNAVYALDQE